jgi:adenosylhomocysteine nucleosidase
MIGVVCGLEIEANSLRMNLTDLESTTRKGRQFFTGDFSFERVAIVLTGPGKTLVASGTQLLIDLYQPRLIVGYGCAGAIHPERSIGDVVLATEAIEHDVDSLDPGDVFRCHAEADRVANLLGALRDNAKVSSDLTPGTVVSGDWYIRTREHKQRLWERFEAQSVDWESASLARVAELNAVPWLSIRVVSDLAEEDMAREYSANVVRVLRELAPAFLESLAETGGV